jgi:hypothetical protein
MRKLLPLTLLLFTLGCNTESRYTQQSPEIDTTKAIIENYVAGEWDKYATHYADGATIFFNVTEENPATVQETIAGQKLTIEPLSAYTFVREKDEYEMVVTDEGETWVNFWGLWKGTIAATGETFEIPVHITHQYENGKIVKTHGYWNNSAIQMALMELQEASEMAAMETPS